MYSELRLQAFVESTILINTITILVFLRLVLIAFITIITAITTIAINTIITTRQEPMP